MKIDRKILAMMEGFSEEEEKALKALFTANAITDPYLILILSMFRNVYVFQQMVNSFILTYQEDVKRLESRVDKLERILENNKK